MALYDVEGSQDKDYYVKFPARDGERRSHAAVITGTDIAYYIPVNLRMGKMLYRTLPSIKTHKNTGRHL
jgi:hypothetical protein